MKQLTQGCLPNTPSTISAGLAWHMWTPEPRGELVCHLWFPILHRDLELCPALGTLVMAVSYFTYTGPFKVSLPQARPPRGPVCSEGIDRSSIRRCVTRSGGLTPDEFYSVKQQPSVSWAYPRGFCEGEDRTGKCKKAGREGFSLAACRSDSSRVHSQS